MSAKRIAVIGSANKLRNQADHQWPYEPRLLQAERAPSACRELGAALAAAGWDIIVYAGEGLYHEGGFIEPDVVDGFLTGATASASARDGTVHVYYSSRYPEPDFPQKATHRKSFHFRADVSDQWESSFYRSLAEVDAALIIGGGKSAFVAGLVCLVRPIPILALAGFGAGGKLVHRAMVDAAMAVGRENLELLGKSTWEDGDADALVDSLASQQESLDEVSAEQGERDRRRRHTRSAMIALALFVVAALLIPTALVIRRPDAWFEYALLFMAPLVAGASGGTIRVLLPNERGLDMSTVGSAALGAVAGGVSGLGYVMSQLASSPNIEIADLSSRQYQIWVVIGVVIGFVSGIALDAVYQKLVAAGAAREIGV